MSPPISLKNISNSPELSSVVIYFPQFSPPRGRVLYSSGDSFKMSTFQLGQTFKLPLPGRGSGAENQMNAQLFGFPEYVLQYNVCAVKREHF